VSGRETLSEVRDRNAPKNTVSSGLHRDLRARARILRGEKVVAVSFPHASLKFDTLGFLHNRPKTISQP
jgi:hypothetical protein